MNMKKIMLAAVSVLLCAALLAGCGSNDAAEEFSYSGPFTEAGSWDGIDAADYVTLGDYASLTLPADVTTPDPDEVELFLSDLMADYAETAQVTDRAVQQGDTVCISYVGSIDGIPFEGGSTGDEGTTVTIGVTQYIDDFLDQLVGHKPGETVSVEVTFPDDYGSEELNGKDAIFVTDILYIEESVIPELTDSFVALKFSDALGVKTVAELTAAVEDELVRNAALDYVRQWLVDNSTVSAVPEEMVAYEEASMLQSYDLYAQQYDMELEDFLTTYLGVDSATLLANEKQVTEDNVRYYLIIEQVAVAEGVEVTDEYIADFFTKNTGSADYSEYVDFYGEGYVNWVARVSMTEDLLVDRLLAK